MANKMRGEVTVKLFGKTMTMRPTFQSMAAIEGRLGMGCIPLMRLIATQDFGVVHIVVVLTEGLKGAGYPATENRVGEEVVEVGFTKFARPVSEFLRLALGADKKEEDELGEDEVTKS